MDKKDGRFKRGEHRSPTTEFKPGQHWRSRQPFWDREWLYHNYVELGRSGGDIARQFGIADTSIHFWIGKHGIPRRTTSEARALKHWGASGSDNPMWNRRGELNPRWLGGVTPERQAFYTSEAWRAACTAVWRRDGATCQRCGLLHGDQPDMPMHVHHIVSFAVAELRSTPHNLVLLCEACHLFVHSRRNTNGEFLPQVGDS